MPQAAKVCVAVVPVDQADPNCRTKRLFVAKVLGGRVPASTLDPLLAYLGVSGGQFAAQTADTTDGHTAALCLLAPSVPRHDFYIRTDEPGCTAYYGGSFGLARFLVKRHQQDEPTGAVAVAVMPSTKAVVTRELGVHLVRDAVAPGAGRAVEAGLLWLPQKAKAKAKDWRREPIASGDTVWSRQQVQKAGYWVWATVGVNAVVA